MARLTITLTHTQRDALTRIRDTHTHPALRERAAAVLQVADGKTIKEVAHTGLVHPRKADTVSSWVRRYLQEGVARLAIRPGHGRKPRPRSRLV